MTREQRLQEALQAALEWIDAVPSDVAASLPAMPGFDRDDVDGLIAGRMDSEDQGKTIVLRAIIGYPGSRVTDLLVGGEKVSLRNETIRSAMLSDDGKPGNPADAPRKHVPELERWAYNQMPKTSDHHEVRLYRYVGTHLYQWYSKVGTSVFSEPVGEPFLGEPA